jgi:hypothetical protein
MGGNSEALHHSRLKPSSLPIEKSNACQILVLFTYSVELNMKDLSQVLSQKEMAIERVRKEIKALKLVIPLLAEDADWIEHGLASSPSVSQLRGAGTAGVKGQPRTER